MIKINPYLNSALKCQLQRYSYPKVLIFKNKYIYIPFLLKMNILKECSSNFCFKKVYINRKDSYGQYVYFKTRIEFFFIDHDFCSRFFLVFQRYSRDKMDKTSNIINLKSCNMLLTFIFNIGLI
jgi:hypothetical protein